MGFTISTDLIAIISHEDAFCYFLESLRNTGFLLGTFCSSSSNQMFFFTTLKRYHEALDITSPSFSTGIFSGSVVKIYGRVSVAVEGVSHVILSVESSAIVSNCCLVIPYWPYCVSYKVDIAHVILFFRWLESISVPLPYLFYLL